jgi:hypothetical protein
MKMLWKNLLLLTIALIILACDKVSNTIDQAKLDCSVAMDHNYVKLLDPNGKSLTSDTEFKAFLRINGSWQSLPIHGKGCVNKRDIPTESDSTYVVKARNSMIELHRVGRVSDLNEAQKLTLRQPNTKPTSWRCPLPVAGHHRPLIIAWDAKPGTESPYLFRYRIKQGSRTFRNSEHAIDLSEAAIKLQDESYVNLPEGVYQVETEVIDLSHFSQEETLVQAQNCVVEIDQTAPDYMLPDQFQVQDSEFKGGWRTISPGLLLSFQAAQKQDASPFLCLESIEESHQLASSKCATLSEFSALRQPYFLPSEGTWRLHYFLKDTAGNQSAPVNFDLLVVNDLLISSIRDRARTTMLLARDTAEESLKEAIKLLQIFFRLKTKFEQNLVNLDILQALLTSGSVDTIRERISFSDPIFLVQGEASGEGYWILTAKSELFRLAWPSRSLSQGVRLEHLPKLMSVKHQRLFAQHLNHLIVYDFAGKESLRFKMSEDENLISIQEGSTHTLLKTDRGAYVLKGDVLVQELVARAERKLWDVAFDSRDQVMEVYLTKTPKTISLLQAGVQKDLELVPECTDNNWTIKEISFSPQGRFIQTVTQDQSTELFDIEGESLHCEWRLGKFLLSEKEDIIFSYRNSEKLHTGRSEFTFDLKKFHDGQTENLLASEVQEGLVYSAQILPQDRAAFYTSNRRILLFNTRDLSYQELNFSHENLQGFLPLPESKDLLLVSGHDLILWTPGQYVSRFLSKTHQRPLGTDAVAGPQGQVLYLGQDQTLVLEWPDGRQKTLLEDVIWVDLTAFQSISPGFAWAAITSSGSNVLGFVGSDSEQQTFSVPNIPKRLIRDQATGKWLALFESGELISYPNSIRYDFDFCPNASLLLDLDISDDGNWAVALCSNDRLYQLTFQNGGWVKLADQAAVSQEGQVKIQPHGLGSILTTSRSGGKVYWWNFGDNQLQEIQGIDVNIHAVIFDGSGTNICFNLNDGFGVYDFKKLQMKLVKSRPGFSLSKVLHDAESQMYFALWNNDQIDFIGEEGQLIHQLSYRQNLPTSRFVRDIHVQDQKLLIVHRLGIDQVSLRLSEIAKRFCLIARQSALCPE